MRSTHRNCICYNFHWIIKSIDWYFKHRITILINWFVFFITNQHIVIVRTAPFYRSGHFAILNCKSSRTGNACFTRTTFHFYFCCIVSVFQFQIFSSYFFCISFFCIRSFSIGFFLRICYFYFMIVPFVLLSDQSNVKFFVNGRNRNVKSINFFGISITIGYFICCRLKNLSSVFLGIICLSNKKVYNLL